MEQTYWEMSRPRTPAHAGVAAQRLWVSEMITNSMLCEWLSPPAWGAAGAALLRSTLRGFTWLGGGAQIFKTPRAPEAGKLKAVGRGPMASHPMMAFGSTRGPTRADVALRRGVGGGWGHGWGWRPQGADTRCGGGAPCFSKFY